MSATWPVGGGGGSTSDLPQKVWSYATISPNTNGYTVDTSSLALTFDTANKSGFLAGPDPTEPLSFPDVLNLVVGGKVALQIVNAVGQGYPESAQLNILGHMYPAEDGVADLGGGGGHRFKTVWAMNYKVGDSSSTDAIWMTNTGDGLMQFGARGGADDRFFFNIYSGNRNKVYIQGSDSDTAYSFGVDDDENANSTRAHDVRLKAQSKTAGTGDGGDVLVQPGTSAGGAAGHFYIPSVAGAPSGTPTAHTGFIPMQFDSTNNKLYAYLNGAWKSVTLA